MEGEMMLPKFYKDGQPCSFAGCLSPDHACYGCGRNQAKGNAFEGEGVLDRDFKEVRGKINDIVEQLPDFITLEEALRQAEKFKKHEI